MKRLMMTLFFASVLLASQAQPNRQGPRKPESIEQRIEKAKNHLGLSDDQVEQWKSIHEKYESDLQEARKNRDREKGETLRKKIDEELIATLNEQQKEKFAEVRKKGRKRRKN